MSKRKKNSVYNSLIVLMLVLALMISFFTGFVKYEKTTVVDKEERLTTAFHQISDKSDKDVTAENETDESTDKPDEKGTYTSKEDVARYINAYGKLPDNFITKDEARDLGWPGGNLQSYAPGKSIGGDYFGHYEGKLPKRKGLSYHECDIDTMGKKSRGSKRLIYGTDGSIYYTDDHYESFEMLYGGEG